VYQRRRPRDCPKEYNREAKSALAVVNNCLEVRHWRRTSRQFGQTISLRPACGRQPGAAAEAGSLQPACARQPEEAAKAENWLTACVRQPEEAAEAANLQPACVRQPGAAEEEVKR
jgi:hypothetical protein